MIRISWRFGVQPKSAQQSVTAIDFVFALDESLRAAFFVLAQALFQNSDLKGKHRENK